MMVLLLLIALVLALFGFSLGLMHFHTKMEAKRRVAQKNRHTIRPGNPVEPSKQREAVAALKIPASDTPLPSPSLKYSGNDMIRRLRHTMQTREDMMRLEKTDQDVWKEPWDE